MEFMAKDIETLGELPGRRVGSHVVPDVERVLVAFCQLFGDERATGRDRPLLRRKMDCGRVATVRRRGLGVGRRRGGCRQIRRGHDAFRGNPGDEAFQILLLIVSKAWVLRHRGCVSALTLLLHCSNLHANLLLDLSRNLGE
jgi:hypothetical protein